jgi:methylated-DNA-[protein]-cysteine S-methyltransferase
MNDMSTKPTTMWMTTTPSPLGPLLLVRNSRGLAGLYMSDQENAPSPGPSCHEDATRFDDVKDQLDSYFVGRRMAFDLTLAPEGTPFQRAVWSLLVTIPHGTTTTYAALAARLGRPGALRAVGAANARNPIGIIVPCHRVVGADGSLTGYAGGIERKRWLLEHEGALLAMRAA